MNSKVYCCLICSEITLAAFLAAGAAQSYGLGAPLTCRRSRTASVTRATGAGAGSTAGRGIAMTL